MPTQSPTKRCTRCKAPKPLDEFHRDRTTRDGRASRCKPCACARSREWYRENPERARAAQQAWTERNREKVNADQRARAAANPGKARAIKLKSRYGMTEDEYQEKLAAQSGGCAICGAMTEYPLHVDHDHETQERRGLLCGPCNSGIGFLDDNPERLRAAAFYLEAYR